MKTISEGRFDCYMGDYVDQATGRTWWQARFVDPATGLEGLGQASNRPAALRRAVVDFDKALTKRASRPTRTPK